MSDLRPSILAIDDTPENLLTLGSLLAPEFKLRIATSGAMAAEYRDEETGNHILRMSHISALFDLSIHNRHLHVHAGPGGQRNDSQ